MSELPWENKKVADIMSSAGEEAKISDGSAPGTTKSFHPPIPDILANAFADIPMEEATIELSDSTPDAKDVQMPNLGVPSFGDLPDLSLMGGSSNKEPELNSGNSLSQGILPPFMSNSNIPNSSVQKEENAFVPKPLFDPLSSDNAGANAIGALDAPAKKRSPPPLFEPLIQLDDAVNGADVVVPFPIQESESMSFPSNEFLVEGRPAPEMPPFGEPSSDSVNPFASPNSSVAPPFNEPPSGSVNPFASPSSSAAPPFNEPPSGSVNPFASPGSSAASPFSEPSYASVNPFTQAPVGMESSSVKNGSKSEGSKVNINLDSLKKNIEGISVVAIDFLRNLTKGKSLIDRMEDMSYSTRDDVSSANTVSTISSPFDSESTSPLDQPSINPFSPLQEGPNETEPPLQSNPFESITGSSDAGDIRKVTSIENPILEAINPFDENETDFLEPDSISDENDVLSLFDSDIVGITPIGGEGDQDIVDDVDVALPEILDSEINVIEKTVFSFEKETHANAAEGSAVSPVLSLELKAMKESSDKRFNILENDIINFKDDLTSIDMQFSFVKEEVISFSGKVSEMEQAFSSFVISNEESTSLNNAKFDGLEEKISSVGGRIGNFESNLSFLQSDNVSIKSDLSRIEDNVSELVNSYTALLAQLHESFQENESNFSRIDVISAKLDEIGSKISSIEKTQEGSKSTSMEFSRSISAMLDNLGKTSSAFSDFKQESETKNAAMIKKIDSVTEYVESELQKVGARSYKGFGQNVHLSNIVKNSGNMKLCMEWLEFLMELVGRNNLPEILSYYEELGWITDKIRMELLQYADGIDFYMEKPDWKLTPDDHVKSIWFIESLAGIKVDKNRLSVIERDIEKVKKGSEIYGI
ncbi:FlaD/FlaE family flagellar protein [Methanolobus sp.]|uniref:FlaD/FlaE family flagellar protein n=1 Tax=Methanolobus sp. TaxID=1874737 RepID=UPI0025D2E829|nr:FlaD/FlaE family flagellar protein [Methanolobus sp.]